MQFQLVSLVKSNFLSKMQFLQFALTLLLPACFYANDTMSNIYIQKSTNPLGDCVAYSCANSTGADMTSYDFSCDVTYKTSNGQQQKTWYFKNQGADKTSMDDLALVDESGNATGETASWTNMGSVTIIDYTKGGVDVRKQCGINDNRTPNSNQQADINKYCLDAKYQPIDQANCG